MKLVVRKSFFYEFVVLSFCGDFTSLLSQKSIGRSNPVLLEVSVYRLFTWNVLGGPVLFLAAGNVTGDKDVVVVVMSVSHTSRHVGDV